jgi:hypothetical protein
MGFADLTMKLAFLKRPVAWPFIATVYCMAWSIVFWAVFFMMLSWHVLRIPMGLGGADYPILFWPYVLVGALIYECGVGFFARSHSISASRQAALTLWVPFVIIAVALIVFCPMDTQSSYLEYVTRASKHTSIMSQDDDSYDQWFSIYKGKKYVTTMPSAILNASPDFDMANPKLPKSIKEITTAAFNQLEKVTGSKKGWSVIDIRLYHSSQNEEKWFYAVAFNSEPPEGTINITVTIDGRSGVIEERQPSHN